MATIIISDQVQQPWGEWLTEALMDMGGRNISAIALVAKDAKTEDVFVKANIGSILGEADDTDGGSG